MNWPKISIVQLCEVTRDVICLMDNPSVTSLGDQFLYVSKGVGHQYMQVVDIACILCEH